MLLFVSSVPPAPYSAFQDWALRIAPGGYRGFVITETANSMADLCEMIRENNCTEIVTLDKGAQIAIEMAQIIFGKIDYYALPSPSPKNVFLNNTEQVEAILEECEKWAKK